MNINQIICNRCGSIILQKSTAHYQQGEPSKRLPLPFQKAKHNELPKDLETEEFNKWWIVGNMFTFENVGFTHSFAGCKFLACADCEIGPIGFVCPDSNNCFVSVERVEYKN
uniref:Guanine nucleotide exchange factor MSS4 n=1 Tax=Meloidogyne hapla TaxID=6305 RepID=A0A1I8AZH1_MELHA